MSEAQSHHHHHHHGGNNRKHATDDTSKFRQHMFGRAKRNKLIEKALFWTLIVVCFLVMLLLVFAYVVDK